MLVMFVIGAMLGGGRSWQLPVTATVHHMEDSPALLWPARDVAICSEFLRQPYCLSGWEHMSLEQARRSSADSSHLSQMSE